MLGIGTGLLVALASAPRSEREEWLISASITAFTAPLSFYLVADMGSLGRWRIWSALLVGWAAWETFWGWRDRQPSNPPRPGQRPVDGGDGAGAGPGSDGGQGELVGSGDKALDDAGGGIGVEQGDGGSGARGGGGRRW